MPRSLIVTNLSTNSTNKNSRKFVRNSRIIREIPLRDSKKLTPRQREKWFSYIKNHPKIFYATAHIQPGVVDKINISKAANKAASRALAKLLANSKWHMANSSTKIYLDGGLYLADSRCPKYCVFCSRTSKAAKFSPHCAFNAKTVIKGDEKIPAVALASIVAKVTRDRLMRRLSKKFPDYGFEKHKGYGTKLHLATVKKLGASEKHRLTFL